MAHSVMGDFVKGHYCFYYGPLRNSSILVIVVYSFHYSTVHHYSIYHYKGICRVWYIRVHYSWIPRPRNRSILWLCPPQHRHNWWLHCFPNYLFDRRWTLSTRPFCALAFCFWLLRHEKWRWPKGRWRMPQWNRIETSCFWDCCIWCWLSWDRCWGYKRFSVKTVCSCSEVNAFYTHLCLLSVGGWPTNRPACLSTQQAPGQWAYSWARRPSTVEPKQLFLPFLFYVWQVDNYALAALRSGEYKGFGFLVF